MSFRSGMPLGLGLLSVFPAVYAAGGESAMSNPFLSLPTCCPVVELRQYTLHPGQRDVLIDLFDREFLETQEAEGMKVLGQFRDLDRPNRFVWLRGFPDMPARARSLGAFYGGPTWKAHSRAANATMIDSDDVLLLRPAAGTSGFSLGKLQRPGPGSTEVPKGLVIATIYSFGEPPGDEVLGLLDGEVTPLLQGAGAASLGRFVTESSANTFPALPVREGEHVLVDFWAFRDLATYERYLAERDRSPRESREAKALTSRLRRPPETLKLSPTARSILGR